MAKIDDLDLQILSELSEDAAISVPKLSKKIKVNPSVVYSRIKCFSQISKTQSIPEPFLCRSHFQSWK